MAEKAIIGKMTVYETLTMVVPGAMIVFCVWLTYPEMWSKNLCRPEFIAKLNFLFDIAIVLTLFAFSYVAGLLNYIIVDTIWRIFGLRNSTCMIKSILNVKIASINYKKIVQLVKKNCYCDEEICELSHDKVEDIYYEAYTYALKKNSRSNIPFLENQVAMLKGLVIPMSWIIFMLSPEPWGWYRWIAVIAVVVILIILAIFRQKKIIDLVFEDYEYENRVEGNKQQ